MSKELDIKQYPVILWIPKGTIFATMNCKFVDNAGNVLEASTTFDNDTIVQARKDFEEQVGDDEYYVRYVLTDKGLALAKELENG